MRKSKRDLMRILRRKHVERYSFYDLLVELGEADKEEARREEVRAELESDKDGSYFTKRGLRRRKPNKPEAVRGNAIKSIP